MAHRARKRFGQNFLHDPAVIENIVAAIAPVAGERCVEIGPGQGALTQHLIEAGVVLDAIEIDRDLAAQLRSRFGSTLTLHEEDALRFDYCALTDGVPLRIVGNLPYNISTPLLFHLAAQARCLRDIHVMLQKEVVERICANPGCREYGRLTVMLAAHFAPLALFDIGPGAFRPAPRVRSTFLHLTPHAEAPFAIADHDAFALVVRTAFSHRRKTLQNAIKGLVDVAQIEAAGIDPAIRPGEVAPQQFAALAAHAGPNMG